MAFNQAQYEAVTDKIHAGMADLSDLIREIMPAAEAGTDHWYIPGFIKDAVMWLAKEAVDIAESLWHNLTELLKGVTAPIWFFANAYQWTDIKGLASGVVGELSPTVLPSCQHWTGSAADAYAKNLTPQTAAATSISSVADSTTTALEACAGAGLFFYLALGAILVQFIAAMISVIAALGSIAFSWAGVGIAIGDAAISAGFINTAIGALLTVLTAQAGTMVTLHGQAVDESTFPGGRWPNPNTGSYNYAS
jgi:uncharacterized protein YukE